MREERGQGKFARGKGGEFLDDRLCVWMDIRNQGGEEMGGQ